MANEFEDLFIQLFYSTEVWGYLGLFGVVAFAIAVVYKFKVTAFIFIPIFAIMGLEYLTLTDTYGNFIWRALFMFLSSLILMYVFVERAKND